jgi:PucR family transcriptional regulator, purine catabolism regulatory protein
MLTLGQEADLALYSHDSLYMTVSEVLEMAALAGARLLTSGVVAENRRVKSTSVQESPFENFVRPDEFVMTTAMGLGGSNEKLQAVVRCVATAGAACLAIAVGGHLKRVPLSAVRTAESANLPIVELPWNLRFSEITELVLGHVLAQQNRLLQESEHINRILTELVLNGGELNSICKSLASVLKRDITITDTWGDATSAKADREAHHPTNHIGGSFEILPLPDRKTR